MDSPYFNQPLPPKLMEVTTSFATQEATQPGSSPSPASTEADNVVVALIAADQEARARREAVQYEVQKELVRREARRLVDAEERKDERQPIWLSLREQLQRPLTEQQWSIDQLLPLGGNALFAGRYKAGKTTFNGQLIKAYADGTPYLGLFECNPDPDRPVVTIFNYEMSEDQFHRWLRKVDIQNIDNVQVVHLRGLHTPLALPEVRAALAAQLDASRTGLWIVDPASRAFAGAGDVLSNADVTNWLGWLDEVKLKGNVRDLVLNIHMSHAAATDANAERAIGAQAWSAWADSLWFLNFEEDKRNKVKHRVFWAEGRDVSQEKLYVHYDEETMGVILMPDPPSIPHGLDVNFQTRTFIMRAVENNDGISQTGIIKEVRGQGGKGKTDDIKDAIQGLADDGLLVIVELGRGKGCSHHIAQTRPPLT